MFMVQISQIQPNIDFYLDSGLVESHWVSTSRPREAWGFSSLKITVAATATYLPSYLLYKAFYKLVVSESKNNLELSNQVESLLCINWCDTGKDTLPGSRLHNFLSYHSHSLSSVNSVHCVSRLDLLLLLRWRLSSFLSHSYCDDSLVTNLPLSSSHLVPLTCFQYESEKKPSDFPK